MLTEKSTQAVQSLQILSEKNLVKRELVVVTVVCVLDVNPDSVVGATVELEFGATVVFDATSE